MKIVLATTLVLAQLGSGPPEGTKVTAKQLIEAPRLYVGQKIVLDGIGCVDPGKTGFVCTAVVSGQALKIEASILGPKTAQGIAERLIGECKGTANLARPKCRVAIEIEPTSSHRDMMETEAGTMPISVVVSPRIEMFRSRG